MKRASLRRVTSGVALLCGAAALLWQLDRQSGTPLISFALAATKSKSRSKSDATTNPETGEQRAKLFYIAVPWNKVFQDVANNFDLQLINDHIPVGRLTRLDKSELTLEQTLGILNKEMHPQGLKLIVKGQYLLLIEDHLDRPQYQPYVLPRKQKPEPVEPVESQPETTASDGFRSDSITGGPAKKDRSQRRTESKDSDAGNSTPEWRQSNKTTASKSDQPSTARNKKSSRSVRQVSHEEATDEGMPLLNGKPQPADAPVLSRLEEDDKPQPHVVYKARNVKAVELSRRIYRALKSTTELVESGRNGLPAFRIAGPQAKLNDAQPDGDRPERPVDFLISIDEARNELLIDGTSRDIAAASKLLKVLDVPDDRQLRTQIRPSTKYVCQIADQLPAEIERIRAARGSSVLARHPVDERQMWANDDGGRRAPQVAQDEALPPPAPTAEAESELGEALGSFKGEVNIEVIDDLNVMIIRGNQRDVDQIMRVIKRIEKLSEASAPQVHLLHLKNVDSESLAELLTSVFEKLTKFPGKGTQPRESVAIIAVTKPNSLLIIAPEAEKESIIDLAEQFDQPVDPQTEFEVFRLKSAIATEVETQVTEFYKERKSLGAKVLVIADPRSNALIVRARPRDLDEIKSLIKSIDNEDVKTVNQVKIFRLKNAVATELAAVINAAIQSVLSPPSTPSGGGGFGGQGGGQGLGGAQVDEQFKGVKAAVLQFLSIEKGGVSRQYKSGILSDIRVTPDAHANSLIVTASEKSMELVSALIQSLDRPTSTVSEIKIFTLENADASLMVQQLNALFNNQQQGGNQQRQLPGIALANADDSSSSLVPMKFSVDTRTNSVIATGSPDSLRVVEAILLRLDESNLRSRKNEVVRLNNAPVTQIAAAVTQFFQQQRDISQNDPNLVSNVEQLEREVIVIPDTISNNLLVSATPRYFPSIMTMIKRLDSEPKQVVIQALIVEVQLNNTDEFGIELGLQSPVLFDRSLKQTPVVQTSTNTTGQLQTTTQTLLSQEGTPGFNFNNPGVPLGNNILAGAGTVGYQSLTNFSVGRVNSQLGYGGLVLSAGSQSVNALLRALSSKTKIQILSRPQIRALDSQLAEVFVGQTIPTVTSFQTNATTGVISPTLTQRETGIIMQVTPRINQDGNIVIQLYANRSQLSQQTINVTTDSRGQPVGQRITDQSYVRSTVLVPANSTIVIGGMISSRDEASVRKVPFLGEFPVLGSLFRYDSRSTVRSELLIFLTPRIVNGPEEEECLKEIEMGRLHFIESEAEEAHGPLRAIQAPEELFDDEPTPWVKPPIPPAPAPPLPAGIPLSPPATPVQPRPPAPPQEPMSPTGVPPAPPLPDPSVTRINALRAKAMEQDDDDSDGSSVSPANFVTPSTLNKKTTTPKRLFNGQNHKQ